MFETTKGGFAMSFAILIALTMLLLPTLIFVGYAFCYWVAGVILNAYDPYEEGKNSDSNE